MRSPLAWFKSIPRPLAILLVVALVLGGLGISWATVGVLTSDQTSTEPVSTSPTPSPSDAQDPGALLSDGTGGGGKDNAIVVVNRHDGKDEHRAGLGTARVLSEEAGNKNFAYAYSSCTDCRSVAVAVQVVLIMSNPAVVTPQNFAIAVNELCTRCTTVALAYQYVITTDGVVRFSAEGNARMASLEREISSLAGSAELDPPTLEARVDPLVKQIWGLVDEELVKVGRPAEKQEKKDTDVATEDNTPNPTPPPSTPGPSPSPALSPPTSPSPRESSTPTATASPSPSAA
jgi:putative peptide zinc metalloprotease protein